MTAAIVSTGVRDMVRRVDLGTSGAALIGVAILITWVSVSVAGTGVGHADDAVFALTAKAVAAGQGYGIPGPDGRFVPFGPPVMITSGPPLILPLAVLIALFGPSDLLPGLTGLALFVGLMSLVGVVLARRFGRSATVGFMFTLLLLLLLGNARYFMFGTFLGEPTTFGFILLGSAVLAAHTGPRAVIGGAVCLGLALLTKQIALFPAAGVVAMFIGLELHRQRSPSQIARRGVGLVVLVGAPFVLFEAARFLAIGVDAYASSVRETFAHGLSLRVGAALDAATRVDGFLAAMHTAYVPIVVAAALGIAAGAMFILVRRRGVAPDGVGRFATLLSAGAVASVAYYVLLSPLWERYLWVGFALFCAAIASPMLGLPPKLRPIVVVASALITVSVGLLDPLVSLQARASGSADHAERLAVARYLDARPVLPVAAQDWQSSFEVMYLQRSPAAIVYEPGVSQLRGRGFVGVIDRAFTDPSSPFYRAVTEDCQLVTDGQLPSSGRMSVYSCGAPFWRNYPNKAPASVNGISVLDPLTVATAFTPGSDATLSTVPDQPYGQRDTAGSIRVAIADLPPGATSASSRNVSLDLSGTSDRATFKIWVKASTVVDGGRILLMFWSSNGWAAYDARPTSPGAWQELTFTKGSPASASDIDWTDVTMIQLRVDAPPSGTYTGDVLFRDLRSEDR